MSFELLTSDDDTLIELDAGASVWLGGTDTGFKVDIADAYFNSSLIDLGKLDLIMDVGVDSSLSVMFDVDYAREDTFAMAFMAGQKGDATFAYDVVGDSPLYTRTGTSSRVRT